jgi:hypothetical protein
MANVLDDENKAHGLALGHLGWPLRRIEDATGVSRETASAYLKAPEVPVRPPRTRPAGGAPSSSACEGYREVIELACGQGGGVQGQRQSGAR